MKQILFYIGLDVHENMTAYAVRSYKGSIILSGECATRYEDLHKRLELYLCSCRIGLESCTSYYHIYWSFKKKGYDILVANTLRIRQLVAKDDRLDAERLSDMLRLGSFPTSYVPDEILMRLRSLVNLRQNFVEESTSFQNQIKSTLAKHGLQIHERTNFSKRWCEQLQRYIAEHPELPELYHTYEHYQMLEHKITTLTAEILTFGKKYWSKEMALLDSIPGIAEILSSYFVAEICPISRFFNEKKLRRYAGVIPCFKESGGKCYGSNLPKTSSRSLLRWALVQASWAAVKGKNNLARYYQKKKKTRPKTKAIMAVASSLSDIIFKVLSTGKPYVKQSCS